MIYADYNGSAPFCDEVKDYIVKRLESGGPCANPNAIHYLGNKVLRGMEKARKVCAKHLGARKDQLFFNSGASEGISTVFYSTVHKAKERGKSIIIMSGIEHSACVNAAKYYEKEEDVEVRILPTSADGIVDKDTLAKWLQADAKKVALVCVMAANNETGVIQPYNDIGRMCFESDVPFFCDTTQIIGKGTFSFEDSCCDFAVMSGHKIGALTGAGILMAKEPTQVKGIVFGGGQEDGTRGGTQNYIGNETLAVALDYCDSMKERYAELKEKRIEFEKKLKTKFPNIVIIGENAPRLASTTFVALPGVHGQAVQIELESQDIFVNTSSACSDNEPVTSKVLKAMGVTDEIGRGVVRISLGLCSPLESYDEIYDALVKAYEKLAKIKH